MWCDACMCVFFVLMFIINIIDNGIPTYILHCVICNATIWPITFYPNITLIRLFTNIIFLNLEWYDAIHEGLLLLTLHMHSFI